MMNKKKYRFKYVPVDELEYDANNVRLYNKPEIVLALLTDGPGKNLARSMLRIGYLPSYPMTIVNNTVIDGNVRLAAINIYVKQQPYLDFAMSFSQFDDVIPGADKLQEIPCIVYHSIEDALVSIGFEHLYRSKWNSFQRALYFQRLVSLGKDASFIADVTSHAQSGIERHLDALDIYQEYGYTDHARHLGLMDMLRYNGVNEFHSKHPDTMKQILDDNAPSTDLGSKLSKILHNHLYRDLLIMGHSVDEVYSLAS